jgi:phosphomevalonate decarboxylase
MTDARKATARAHPIQGLVKYHGMRDEQLRFPYHDSISLCTAPSSTTTTAAFEPGRAEDRYVVDGEVVEGRGAERIRAVVDHVRDLAGVDHRVRFESENSFPTNIGFGSSSSGFAAAAMALVEAAGLDMTRPEISTVARRGSSSAARAVTGGFSHLRAGKNDADCRSERIDVPESFAEDVRVVAAMVPAYKETEAAHREAAESHMFEARLAHIHDQIVEMRDALREGDFGRVFDTAEQDSLSLAATTMTGPAGWVYWQPRTIDVFNAVRELREEGVPVYFSVDTGASVYVNTTAEHVDRVEAAVADCGVDTRVWAVGGPAEIRPSADALF